jgi:N6-L-threonylcarbamoyladenine synthase
MLGIETSCDETAIAVAVNGVHLKSNVIASQIKTHARFGGVVPEIASRKHLENISYVLEEALKTSQMSLDKIHAVAVTFGPGLVGALLVGVSMAKAIAYSLDVPLVPVHHLVGHIYASLIAFPELQLPVICLVASGGHTSLVYWRSHQELQLLGKTIDDAAGEVLDKIARAIGLGYPGGPRIEQFATGGNPEAMNFPRAWLGADSLDFSFSGLKSAVINYIHKPGFALTEDSRCDLAASFQQAVIEVLVEKTIRAAKKKLAQTVVIAGGVAANKALRRLMALRAKQEGITTFFPPPDLCTDNAAMIACAGYYQLLRGKQASLALNAQANVPLAL